MTNDYKLPSPAERDHERPYGAMEPVNYGEIERKLNEGVVEIDNGLSQPAPRIHERPKGAIRQINIKKLEDALTEGIVDL